MAQTETHFVLVQGSNNEAVTELSSRGAKVVAVDYDSVSALASSLTGVDVVISALGYAAIFAQQLNLAAASKIANVDLFIPSQYGLPGRAGIPSEKELKEKLDGVGMSVFLDGALADILFKYACVF